MPEGEKRKNLSGRLTTYCIESKSEQNSEGEKKGKVIHMATPYFNCSLFMQGEAIEEHKTSRK